LTQALQEKLQYSIVVVGNKRGCNGNVPWSGSHTRKRKSRSAGESKNLTSSALNKNKTPNGRSSLIEEINKKRKALIST